MAIQYGFMAREFRFCPQCGGRTQLNHNQIAMQCNDCRKLHYPRIFPSIIVAVRRDDKVLLAQHQRHKGGLFTVLAGFVEVGETLEMAVSVASDTSKSYAICLLSNPSDNIPSTLYC